MARQTRVFQGACGALAMVIFGGFMAWMPQALADQTVSTDIAVEGAWVRETPPGQSLSVGYLRVFNHTSDTVHLTAVESPAVRVIELHEGISVDDVMSMRRVDQITIPPGSAGTELKPGGYHLMLIDMTTAPRQGDRIPLTLIFQDESRLTVSAEVRSDPPDQAVYHHEHQH